MKDKMYEFIKIKTPELEEVLGIQFKEIDDEDGFIGDYVVDCILTKYSKKPFDNESGTVNKTCIVNKSEFKKWLKKEESIKWL